MARPTSTRSLLAALTLLATVILLTTTCGCVALPRPTSHLCRCQKFACDDYCPKCDLDVCAPERCQKCDDYCRKCPTPDCLPCHRLTCDDYCPKPLPGYCCEPVCCGR